MCLIYWITEVFVKWSWLHWLQTCQADYYCKRHLQASRLRRANVFLNFPMYFLALRHAFGYLELLSEKGILEGAVWCSKNPNQWLWEGNLWSSHAISGRCLANLHLKTSHNRVSHLLWAGFALLCFPHVPDLQAALGFTTRMCSTEQNSPKFAAGTLPPPLCWCLPRLHRVQTAWEMGIESSIQNLPQKS